MKTIIIGAGASGLISAIYAAKNSSEVIILEKNDTSAKKILITGNGRCNYNNEDQNINHYHSENNELIKDIITKENTDEIMKFFNKIGIVPKIKDGYYYPYSNQATSIKEALLTEAKIKGIKIITGENVTKINKNNNQFVIKTENNTYSADKVILATGSKAYPKTGSDGSGYILASSFGHKITNIYPSLSQLKGEESYFKNWSGVRADVKVSLLENNKIIKEEKGEIQLTNNGVSGICVFNLSGLASKGLMEGKKEEIVINFMPWLNSFNEASNYLEERNKKLKNRTIEQFLEGFLNYKLIHVILKLTKINKDDFWNELNIEKKKKLIQNLISFTLKITKISSFEESQVCKGGVSLEEINVKTMESKLEKDLYVIGELLDVDGDCGGYNLTFAWISGMLAGKNIGDKND